MLFDLEMHNIMKSWKLSKVKIKKGETDWGRKIVIFVILKKSKLKRKKISNSQVKYLKLVMQRCIFLGYRHPYFVSYINGFALRKIKLIPF